MSAPSRRIHRALISAALLAATAAACSTPDMPAAPVATITVPGAVPSTFDQHASWQALGGPTPPVSSLLGVLTLQPVGAAPGVYRAALLDSATGQPRWATVPFASPTAAPDLHQTAQNGAPWAVVVIPTGTRDVRVFAFDLSSGSQQTAVTTAKTFSGSRTRPTVTISDDGVLIRGAAKTAFQYRPDTGTRTIYRKGPSRGAKAATPYLVHHDGFLVTYPRGGFAFASASGGWDSAAVAPAGTTATGGSIVAFSDDLILARWARSDGQASLAVHNLSDGRVLAEQTVSPDALANTSGWRFVVADDASSAAWGTYAFGLTQPSLTRVVDLGGGQPTLIRAGVVYATGTTRPVAPAAASPTASPSSSGQSATPSGSASPAATAPARSTPTASPSPSPSAPTSATPAGATGSVAVDLATGEALDQRPDMVVPSAISQANQGLFTVAAPDGSTTLFSVALR